MIAAEGNDVEMIRILLGRPEVDKTPARQKYLGNANDSCGRTGGESGKRRRTTSSAHLGG
jgi:hypothetical protein